MIEAGAELPTPAAQTAAYRAATALLAVVWLANGLGAKLLGLVPRHQAIVARFFGDAAAPLLTRLIGVAEILMAAWIASGRFPRACAWAIAGTLVAMNSLELWRARDLLLFPTLMPLANLGLIALAFWRSRSIRATDLTA
jgi:uncharacterized membrane protein YphA (DoxX/SURF4 family)